MSRVCKKILSLFGLALVIAITAIASGVPPAQQEDASAAQHDVKISFTIEPSAGSAHIVDPVYGRIFYDGNNGLTALVEYSNASSLRGRLVAPNGSSIEVPITISQGTATIQVSLASFLTQQGYGNYTFEVDGIDLSGNPLVPSSTAFSYHAITTEPTPGEDGLPVGGSIRVYLGASVCRLDFKVYPKGDTSSAPLKEFSISDFSQCPPSYTAHPEYIDAIIPDIDDAFLDANGEEFTIVVTAIKDCNSDGTGGTTLEDGSADITAAEPELPPYIPPPNTGIFSIFDNTVGRADLLITCLGLFIGAVGFAAFLIKRSNKKNNRR